VSRKLGAIQSELKKHKLALLLISERPSGWDSIIGNHIKELNKNSFYLFDVFHTLKHEYQFGRNNDKNLKTIATLIKMSIAKHEKGIESPGAKVINKVSDDVLPKRMPAE
jgi:hypothetical protein